MPLNKEIIIFNKEYKMKKNGATWENWLSLILGAWVFATPWVFNYSDLLSSQIYAISWNHWVTGVVLIVTSGFALQMLRPWEEWVNLLAGAWLFLSPWIFNYTIVPNLFWNSLIVGALVVLFSTLALPVARKLQQQHVLK